MDVSVHDAISAKLRAGERLEDQDIRELAASPDILALGMLADEMRRRARGTRVTYVRVASVGIDSPPGDLPSSAREVRIIGSPATLDMAVTATRAVRTAAGDRYVSGFSLADLAGLPGASLDAALRSLRDAGLDMVADVPIDRLEQPEVALAAMESAGFARARLTVDRAPTDRRVDVLLRARSLAERFRTVAAISPLPMVLNAFRPTTGYDDVKMVALARIALPAISIVQVDWRRYGPKLAQVALTFGADDVDNVPAGDDAPDGPRRSTLADLRRNIEAAGFDPTEREGTFTGK